MASRAYSRRNPIRKWRFLSSVYFTDWAGHQTAGIYDLGQWPRGQYPEFQSGCGAGANYGAVGGSHRAEHLAKQSQLPAPRLCDQHCAYDRRLHTRQLPVQRLTVATRLLTQRPLSRRQRPRNQLRTECIDQISINPLAARHFNCCLRLLSSWVAPCWSLPYFPQNSE